MKLRRIRADVSLTTNVNVIFSYGYSVEVISGPAAHPFTFDIAPAFPATTPVNGDGTTHEYSDISVKVSMNTDAGNNYQGCKYKIQFFVKAVQGNMPSTTVAAVNTTGANNINLQSSTNTSTTASLQFTGSNATPLVQQNLTVSMIPDTASGYTTTDTTDVVLGGISVTTDATGSALAGTPTTVSFVIPGQYTSNDIKILHNNTTIIDRGTPIEGVTIPEGGLANYDSINGTTTITFITTLGFSNYYVTGNFPVVCDGKYYKTFIEAINATTYGSMVKLISDVNLNTGITITKNITLDLNGFTINADLSSDAGDNPVINAQTTILEIIDSGNDGKIISNEYGLMASHSGKIVIDSIEMTTDYACLAGNNTQGNMNFEISSCTLTSTKSETIYMPGQMTCNIIGSTLNGGISARMGQISIVDSTINGMTTAGDSFDEYWDYSGSAWIGDAIYVWGGTYDSSDATYGRSCNIAISGNSVINGNAHHAIAVYKIGNGQSKDSTIKYDQTISISVDASVTISGSTVLDSSKNQNIATVTVTCQGITLTPIDDGE